MQVKKIHQLTAHSAALYAMAPGRTLGTLFSAGADKVVAEWNLETGETNAFAIRTERTVYSLLNLNRQFLVIGTIVGGMHVIDLDSKQEVRHLKFHDKGIFHLLHLPKTNRVVAACADGSISIWNAADWCLERHLPLSNEKIRRVAHNHDESLIAVASGDGKVRLLECSEFKLVMELDAHEEGANSVAFLRNGDLLSGGKDAHLCRWTAKNGFQLEERIPAHNFAIYDIVVADNDALIATASRDKTVKIWNPSDLSSPIRLDRAKAGGHLNSVNAAIWLEEEKLLATCSDDRSVILWELGK
jgi:WD repeat-containing protein 61